MAITINSKFVKFNYVRYRTVEGQEGPQPYVREDIAEILDAIVNYGSIAFIYGYDNTLPWPDGNATEYMPDDPQILGGNVIFAQGKWFGTSKASLEDALGDSNIIEKLKTELNISTLESTVDKKVDKTDVVQSTGTSTTAVMSQKAVSDIIEGNVTNAADEEDITVIEENGKQKLKFADRNYNLQTFSGKGYKILRKNIQTIDGVRKNILTQDMINNPDTIYEIRYDFDLNGAEITVPENCVLKLIGGSINEGLIKLNTNCVIKGNNEENSNLEIIVLDNAKNILISSIVLKSTDFSKENTAIKSISSQAIAYNVMIKDCTITGYRTGIDINCTNLTISKNLLYNNGRIPSSDSCVDIVAGNIQGGSTIQNVNPNIIIDGNKCLSNKVHRNIDVGELYGETNIIISNNICVTMDDEGKNEYIISEDNIRSFKSICILVGYAGNSEKKKTAKITNNICKYAKWSGIYVRADNTKDTEATSKYLVDINGNTIQYIIKPSELLPGQTYLGAIGVELASGSIITNNIIQNCTDGIDLGNVYGKGETLVSTNTVYVENYGITTDSSAEKININNNDITAMKCVGISSTPDAIYDYSSYINISNNNLKATSVGISFSGTLSPQIIHICNNIILSENKGLVVLNSKNRISIIGNSITGTENALTDGMGIQLLADSRLDKVICNNNNIGNYDIGLVVTNSNSTTIAATDNKYTNCNSIYNSNRHILIGNFKADGTFVGRCTDPQLFIDNPRNFVVGDTLFNNNNMINVNIFGFTKATCIKGSTNLDNTFNNDSKWIYDNLRFKNNNTINDSMFKMHIVTGQMAYIIDSKKYIVWNGTEWTNMDGTNLI